MTTVVPFPIVPSVLKLLRLCRAILRPQSYPLVHQAEKTPDTQGLREQPFGYVMKEPLYGSSGHNTSRSMGYSDTSIPSGLRKHQYAYTSPSLSQNAHLGLPIRYCTQPVETTR